MADEGNYSELREKRWHQTARIFSTSEDLLWLYRGIKAHCDRDETLIEKMCDFVADSLWTTMFNKTDDSSLADVQAKAIEYLKEDRLHCATLRNFFLSVILDHVKILSANPLIEIKWLIISILASDVIFQQVGRSVAWLAATPLVVFGIFTFWRLAKTDVAKRLLNQVIKELQIGAFDEAVTAERLRRLESQGIEIPSLTYALLRQPKVNVKQLLLADWQGLSNEQRSEINAFHSAWLKEMREYSENK